VAATRRKMQYTIWDVNKVNTEYNFHNKNFLNTQIEKYGVNHLEDVLYTIYLLNIDKLLPEILISISLCFKKNIAYKEKFVKEIKSSQLIVDMLVLSAYINYSDVATKVA
jgi:hypothetical protein